MPVPTLEKTIEDLQLEVREHVTKWMDENTSEEDLIMYTDLICEKLHDIKKLKKLAEGCHNETL